jgi:hypothetical protein
MACSEGHAPKLFYSRGEGGEKVKESTSMIGLTRERNIGEQMEGNKGTKV